MQVPDEIRHCVVFVCYRDAQGMHLAGTGFLVAVESAVSPGLSYGFVVTARHVIGGIQKASTDSKVYLRMNRRGAPSALLSTEIGEWTFHPDGASVDVAVLPMWPSSEIFDFKMIPSSMAATEEIIAREGIGPGDEVFLTGLFVNHFGVERNLPVVRVGNIALMPEEKVMTQNLGPVDAYLIEARSIGGLSGSPVFVHLGAARLFGNQTRLAQGNIFYWLGLMHGHFDLATSNSSDLVDNVLAGERVNMGIAIVVPVSKILETINQEKFSSARRTAESQ